MATRKIPNPKFTNVKVIEDTTIGEDIPYNDNHLYAGPMSIVDIEHYEDYLIFHKIPYVLVEAETVSETLDNSEIRLHRGYCIFTKVKDL